MGVVELGCPCGMAEKWETLQGNKEVGRLSQDHTVSPQVDRAGALWEPF